MIVRGTTTTQSFIVQLDLDTISKVYITYVQNGRTIIEKTENDLIFNNIDKEIIVTLSQEDTLSFFPYSNVGSDLILIQLRILTNDGNAYASSIIKERLTDVLKNGIIGD